MGQTIQDILKSFAEDVADQFGGDTDRQPISQTELNNTEATVKQWAKELVGDHRDGCLSLNQYPENNTQTFQKQDCDCGISELRNKIDEA